MGLLAAAVLGVVVIPTWTDTPPRQVELEAFRNPGLSADGRTLTVDLPGLLQCGGQEFDGLVAAVDEGARTIELSAWTSRPDPSWCSLDCPIYDAADGPASGRTASITFDQPVTGYVLWENPATPLHCSEGISESDPIQPLSWVLPGR